MLVRYIINLKNGIDPIAENNNQYRVFNSTGYKCSGITTFGISKDTPISLYQNQKTNITSSDSSDINYDEHSEIKDSEDKIRFDFNKNTNNPIHTPIKVTYHNINQKKQTLDLNNSSYWKNEVIKKESVKSKNDDFRNDMQNDTDDDFYTIPDDNKSQSKTNELNIINNYKSETTKVEKKNYNVTNNDVDNDFFEIDKPIYNFKDAKNETNKNYDNVISNNKKEVNNHKETNKSSNNSYYQIDNSSNKLLNDTKSDKTTEKQVIKEVRYEEKEKKDSIFMNLLYVFEIFGWLKDSDVVLRLIVAAVAGIFVFGTIFSQMGLLSKL